MIKNFIKPILILLSSLVIIVAIYFGLMMITDYKPENRIKLSVKNNNDKKAILNNEMSLTTFNIGYCGMDKDVDFFMDGGKMSRSISKEKTKENLKGTTNALEKLNSDFIFLQEVDKKATRSYKVNEYDYIIDKFNNYNSTFAINYKVMWVPVPITKPHGNVLAGLVTLSKYSVIDSTRYSLPGLESWPRRLALLDRCAMVNRIPVSNGKELVLINAHLSAYDKGGKIRKQQLTFLNQFLENEYLKGNYVIAGGDWNHQIPGSNPLKFKSSETWPDWLQKIPSTFKPNGFTWEFDENNPTVRTVVKPYKHGENFTATIDGFIVSNNIQVLNTKVLNLDFRYSDHNPVTIKFKLK